MRRMLFGLPMIVVLLTSAMPIAPAVTAAGAESKTEPVTPVVTDAGPHRWVNEGGPGGGVVDSISLCAAEPNVLYVATNGGIHKSTDGAETWTRMGAAVIEGGARSHPSRILVDPTSADTLYAYANGFIKSTDGGITWASTPGTEAWRGVRALALSTGKTKALYVLRRERSVGVRDEHTVMRSVDGGETWEKCLDDTSVGPVVSLLADPHAPGTLYTVSPYTRAVFSSSDGGATWRQTAGGLMGVSVKACERFDDPKHFKVTLLYNDQECTFETTTAGLWWASSDRPRVLHAGMLDLDPDDPKKLQLTVDSEEHGEVLMTCDAAKTWKALDVPCRAWDLQAISFSATQRDILYAGSTDGDYSFSDDAGETWQYFYSRTDDPRGVQTAEIEELNATFPCLFGTNKAIYQAPVIDPSNPETGYVRDGKGVSKTVDGGATWSAANRGLSTIMILDIAADPKTPGVVYAAGAGGAYKSEDNARTWRLVCGSQECRHPHTFTLSASPQQACCIVAVHPLAPHVVLSAGPRIGACISTDAGETWREISAIPRDGNVLSFFFDPKDAKRFYASSKTTLWETANAGRTWHVRAEWEGVELKRPHDYSWGIIPRGNASVIYRIVDRTRLGRSTDLGKTWKLLDVPSSQGRLIARTDPSNPNAVIVREKFENVFHSTDAGETWNSITAPCFATCIELDPGDPKTFYIGSQDGDVLRTRDGGKTFERFGKGLPEGTLTCIAVSPADGTVYAGTWDAGVYRLVIEEQTEPDESQK